MTGNLLKNRFVFIILVSLVLVGVVGANFAVGDSGPKVEELSLNQAVDLSLKYNPDIQVADLEVKKAEAELKNAKYTAGKIKTDTVNSYELGLAKWVNPKAYDNALVMAKKSSEVTRKTVMFNVENYYYNVLKAERNLAIKREGLKYIQDQLKIAQSAYKIGTKAKLDVNTIEAAVASSQAQVVSEENNYRVALMELNRIIGLDLDTQLKLTTKFAVEKTGNSIKVDETIKKALEDNIEILGVKTSQELAEVKYDVAKKFYAGGVTIFDTAKLDSGIAEAKVKKQEQATISAVRQDYLTLFSLEKVLDWNNKEVVKAQENARIYRLKYEAGLATSLDVKKAAIDLEQAKVTLADTIFNYNLIKAKFKYELFSSASSF